MCKCHQHQDIYRTVPSTLLPIFFAEYYSIAYKYIPQFVDGHWLLSWYEHLFTGLCIDIDLFFLCPFSVSNELGWVQFSCSVVSDSLRPMDYSMPGLPVHHQFSEFTQTHVYWVSDAIQPSHPWSSPSPVFSLYQHQGLFQWVSSLHQVAKVLALQLHHQSFQWIVRIDFL